MSENQQFYLFIYFFLRLTRIIELIYKIIPENLQKYKNISSSDGGEEEGLMLFLPL